MKSTQKYIRTSARKLRLIADAVRGLTPAKALESLKFVSKSAATPLYKAIKAAMANAKENHGIPAERLIFKTLDIGEGATYKRYRAVSRGQGHSILKRTAHIHIELEEAHGTKN